MEKKKLINESGVSEMSMAELRSFIQKMLDKETTKQNTEMKKSSMTKEDVRQIVKDMMIKQYKFFWEKKSFWSNNI